jgi:SET domain-containing protein
MAGKASSKTSHKPYRVGRSPTGLGLFATEPIEKGAFIVEYKGRRITNAQAKLLEARGSRYMYEINSRWTVDGSNRRNKGRYANHSCRPNAESDVVKGKVILRARRKIKPGEEITYDYGREYFDIFLKSTGCKCAKCADKRYKAPRAAKAR